MLKTENKLDNEAIDKVSGGNEEGIYTVDFDKIALANALNNMGASKCIYFLVDMKYNNYLCSDVVNKSIAYINESDYVCVAEKIIESVKINPLGISYLLHKFGTSIIKGE